MAKRRSIQHPHLDMVKLRPLRDEKDLLSIAEHMLPINFGELNIYIGGQ